MLVTVMAELWPFFSVTFCTALAVFWTWLPKDKLAGETVTLWAQRGNAAIKAEEARSRKYLTIGAARTASLGANGNDSNSGPCFFRTVPFRTKQADKSNQPRESTITPIPGKLLYLSL